MEIHSNPANVRSAAIPRRLGYRLVDERDGQGHLIFRLTRAGFASSPCASADLRVFDRAGAPLM